MKALFFSNEFPPNVYGGAGVHVDYLTRELSKLCPVEVRCFGDQDSDTGDLRVIGTGLDTTLWTAPEKLQSVFGALQRGLDFNTRDIDADIVHLHTWYTHFAGVVAKLNYGIPLVVTVHSLEPLRPWKREQLGGGYDFSVWIEKTAIEMADAVIAVSSETKKDIHRHFDVPDEKCPIIYNGIDPNEYKPTEDPTVLERFGIDPKRPYVLFVGRITRQKGIVYLAEAIKYMDPDYQVVLCAGAPDTKAIAHEMESAIDKARAGRDGIIWISEMVDNPTKIVLYSHADVFCCPSIYEPFGIINLEAMACETAVVCSEVGGMPEVVVDGETGYLVRVEQHKESPFTPTDPDKFSRDLAARINELMRNEPLRYHMGKTGRKRAIETFSWEAIARETHSLYERLLS
ncbi:glycogen synthase [soil metagenome]